MDSRAQMLLRGLVMLSPKRQFPHTIHARQTLRCTSNHAELPCRCVGKQLLLAISLYPCTPLRPTNTLIVNVTCNIICLVTSWISASLPLRTTRPDVLGYTAGVIVRGGELTLHSSAADGAWSQTICARYDGASGMRRRARHG